MLLSTIISHSRLLLHLLLQLPFLSLLHISLAIFASRNIRYIHKHIHKHWVHCCYYFEHTSLFNHLRIRKISVFIFRVIHTELPKVCQLAFRFLYSGTGSNGSWVTILIRCDSLYLSVWVSSSCSNNFPCFLLVLRETRNWFLCTFSFIIIVMTKSLC